MATVPVMCYTAWHMGTVAMGTFRVDIVYKIGAVFWAWPAVNFLLWPDSGVDHTLKMLGYSQAFCFVRVASPVSFLTLKLLRAAGITVTKYIQDRRWDVAASCGILTGMLLGLHESLSLPLMAVTMVVAFGIAPLCIADDGRIAAGSDGSKTPRWQ